jgi:hypothetical protein
LTPAHQFFIIDELGFVPLSKTGAELLFELISQHYERGATLITSNLPFDEWTKTLGSERLTGEEWSMIDRKRAGPEASPSAATVDRSSFKAPAGPNACRVHMDSFER